MENKARIQQILHSASVGNYRKTSVEYRGECGAGQTSLQAGETFPSGLAALCTSWTEIILVQNATT